MKKLLTIAIPTYNRADQLNESIRDLLKVLPGECRILVSDNGSTDNTHEICLKYSRFENFNFIESEKNEGYDRNVLKLLENVTTDYIWFLSDDDRITGDLLSIVCKSCADKLYAGILIDAEVVGLNDCVVNPSLSNIKMDCSFLLNEKHLETMYKWSTLISSIVLRTDLAKNSINVAEHALGTLFIQLPLFWLSCLGKNILTINEIKIQKYNPKNSYFETSVFDVWLWNLIDVGRVLERGGISIFTIKRAQCNIYGSPLSMSGLPAHYILSRYRSKVANNRSIGEIFERIDVNYLSKLLILVSTFVPRIIYLLVEKLLMGLKHGFR